MAPEAVWTTVHLRRVLCTMAPPTLEAKHPHTLKLWMRMNGWKAPNPPPHRRVPRRNLITGGLDSATCLIGCRLFLMALRTTEPTLAIRQFRLACHTGTNPQQLVVVQATVPLERFDVPYIITPKVQPHSQLQPAQLPLSHLTQLPHPLLTPSPAQSTPIPKQDLRQNN